jgi:hypothetical protein
MNLSPNAVVRSSIPEYVAKNTSNIKAKVMSHPYQDPHKKGFRGLRVSTHNYHVKKQYEKQLPMNG